MIFPIFFAQFGGGYGVMKEYFAHVEFGGADYYGSYRLSNGRLLVELPYIGRESVDVGLVGDASDPVLEQTAEIVMKNMIKKRTAFETGCRQMTDEIKRLKPPFAPSPFSLLDAVDINKFL